MASLLKHLKRGGDVLGILIAVQYWLLENRTEMVKMAGGKWKVLS